MTQSIRLERGEWTFDESDQLGSAGGFGEVFRGEGGGQAVAVKRLKLSAGSASYREMKIGEALASRAHNYIVPILDYGRDAESDRYFLVMPICDGSLQEEIDTSGPLPIPQTRKIAAQIIEGLIEAGDIVHRDLKPSNILRHEGNWKIADFGIAKFVEDATSLETLREALTPSFAAPEQWRGERPSSATDVYALGCIIYSMLTGSPPFTGDFNEVRSGHLVGAPRPIADIEPRLAGLLMTMLRKEPASRPSLPRCKEVIGSAGVDQPISVGRSALANASHLISRANLEADARRRAAEQEAEAYRRLVAEGRGELKAIVKRLFDEVSDLAGEATIMGNSLNLGSATLLIEFGPDEDLEKGGATRLLRNDEDSAKSTVWKLDPQASWAIVTNAYITLTCQPRVPAFVQVPYRFQTSLVFGALPDADEVRWFEVSFWTFAARRERHQPIGLNPFEEPFRHATGNIMGTYNIASGPTPIDGPDETDFQERWIVLLARAARGELVEPNTFPIPAAYFVE